MYDINDFVWFEGFRIKGIHPDNHFWSEGQKEEDYLRLLVDLQTIKDHLDNGVSISDIETRYPKLHEALYAFFGKQPITLMSYPDGNFTINDGRHRLYVAKKYNYTVPCILINGEEEERLLENLLREFSKPATKKESPILKFIRRLKR